MKYLIIATIVLFSFEIKAQSTEDEPIDSIKVQEKMNELYTYLKDLKPVEHKPKSIETHLRGKFHKAFKNEKLWNEFVLGYDGKYIWIDAPETNWYDGNLGPQNSNRYNLCENIVMVDSTVVNYYNTKIKTLKHDRYKYEIEYQNDGTIREFYKFFVGETKIRSFLLGWNKTELLTITDFDIQDRR
jgi:hypothetical protein